MIFSSDPNRPWTITIFFSFSQSKNNIDESSSSTLNLSHLAFGLEGSENTYHHRKHYLEEWWRPNITRGYVYLDTAPTGDLLPWSEKSPPYRVNDDLSKLLEEIKPRSPLMPRMVHGIFELFHPEKNPLFFVDNLVDVLSKYDHRKYYYIGYSSEFVLSNYWFNFNQAFGGGGIILSCHLAKALVKDIDRCLRTYLDLSADLMTMACLADIRVNLTPHKGVHQTDLRGDLSGFLSSHPKEVVLSLHHFDGLDPLFPEMDRFEWTRHLMRAANMDQSRLFQQTICYHRPKKWSFSIAWGYSVHIYENILRRSWLQTPTETFQTWTRSTKPPHFMFQTRRPFGNPCEAPHVFFFETIQKFYHGNEILTVYSRSAPRGLPACDPKYVSKIHVISPANKSTQVSF
ncbi:hypothetical protein M9H77_14041 [Catharanthus roseus]|uniref:Uncharacterized protein n=1 Tax=Catharanthus roseus TaxID=4058 RepID=A0ACC0BM66_CATRO|nr:hypothetical protein M9H77_14041 [Catharanthus roseus]